MGELQVKTPWVIQIEALQAALTEDPMRFSEETKVGPEFLDGPVDQAIWQRCIKDAIEAKVLTDENRFTFHDLRAYYATKHKKDRGALPDLHANPETTARVYDRNKEVFRSSN